MEDLRATNPLSPIPYNAAVNCCLLHHIKGMCNGKRSRAADHNMHASDQDAPLVNWAEVAIPIPGDATA